MEGGLGVMNVKFRSMALLIRTFMETAAHPHFRHNMYHETLFWYHVLEETSLPNPGFPPYYDKQFFNVIKHVLQHTTMNVRVMTIKQWYRLLLEREVLTGPETEDGPPSPLPLRCESFHPESNWSVAWSLVRTPGLPSPTSSFLFKLLHLLLPTQERIRRLRLDREEVGGLCLLYGAENEDLDHLFFSCPHTAVAGLLTLGWAQTVVPDLTPLQALRLDIGEAQLGREEGLVLTTILGTGPNTLGKR